MRIAPIDRSRLAEQHDMFETEFGDLGAENKWLTVDSIFDVSRNFLGYRKPHQKKIISTIKRLYNLMTNREISNISLSQSSLYRGTSRENIYRYPRY